MPFGAAPPYRLAIATVYQPYIVNGGPVMVTFTPEGGTFNEIVALAGQQNRWARAAIFLTANSATGRVLDTVVQGPTRYSGAPSIARTLGFQRVVNLQPGDTHICVTLAADGDLNPLQLWVTYTPRALSTVQLRR